MHIVMRRGRNYNQPVYGYHVTDINYFLNGIGEHNFQQYINNERHNNELVGFMGATLPRFFYRRQK